MSSELIYTSLSKDKYFLVATKYEKGDKFEIYRSNLLSNRYVVNRYRTEGKGLYEHNILYYSPSLFWAIPLDLHKYKLSIVGMVSELEEFQDVIIKPEEGDYLIIKIG